MRSATVLLGALGMFLVACDDRRDGDDPASAASSDTASYPAYGDEVHFRAPVEGRMAKGSMVYITVVCQQDGAAVYHVSGAVDAGFELDDVPNQTLYWDGGSATCTAKLLYRVQKGKNITTTLLDSITFVVAGQTS